MHLQKIVVWSASELLKPKNFWAIVGSKLSCAHAVLLVRDSESFQMFFWAIYRYSGIWENVRIESVYRTALLHHVRLQLNSTVKLTNSAQSVKCISSNINKRWFIVWFWSELSHNSRLHEGPFYWLFATFHATGSRHVNNVRSTILSVLGSCPG